jgi:hypothetical protein
LLGFPDVSDGLSGQQRYSDDEFDRALRELAEGTAGEPRFREASAAERARQAKQQAKRARRQSRRRRGRGRPERDSRGRATTWTSVGVVLVLAAVGTFAWVQFHHQSTASAVRSIAPTTASVAPTTASITPTTADAEPPALPFAGTPAQSWADGAAGIVIPAARPVGDFTAAQVEAAYQTSRKLLVAGNLNKTTLLGGPPTAFADLLTSQERTEFLGSLNSKGVDNTGRPRSTRVEVTSFAPGSAELIGVIKVRGSMSAKSVVFSGATALAINVNYLFAYAVEPPGNPTDWTRVVAHQYGSFDFAPWGDPGGALTPWDDTGGDHAGALCGSTDGYLRPDYPSDSGSAAGPAPSGPYTNPYSNTGTDGSTACAQTTHT